MEAPIVDKPKFTHFVQWGFYTCLLALAMAVSNNFAELKDEVVKVRTEMVELNSKVAVILEKGGWIDKELERHQREIDETSRRLRALEIKVEQSH